MGHSDGGEQAVFVRYTVCVKGFGSSYPTLASNNLI